VQIVGEEATVTLAVDRRQDEVVERWRAVEGVTSASVRDERVELLTHDANAVLPRLFEAAAAAEARITEVNVVEPNLETVFLHLPGRALRE
jgi:ABC-2 type transport system ATP-binding protein